MPGGYMGRYLWVNLDDGCISDEAPAESCLRSLIGGYGLGARWLYDRVLTGADPLGPANILGFLTGPLTGVAPTGTRFTVVGKSPLTGGWGDANCGGYFGPALKRAGYDGVLFTGVSPRPVYLYLADDKAELRDAVHLWGLDCYEVEEWAKGNLGADAEAACIGPSGEKQALISGVMHSMGRAAARSGLGAVMGSKRLKMVAARGTKPVPVAMPDLERELRRKYLREMNSGVGGALFFRTTGTPGYTPTGARNGDSPVQNWGASVAAFPDTESLEFERLLEYRVARKGCWRCPLACWGTSRVSYGGQNIEAHQPEYETAAAFGSMVLNNDYPSLIRANDLCNRYGLDTISAGACVAFAVECYQHGLIGATDTGGIELSWGNHEAMNALLEMIARREGLGDLLADGVRAAAARLGPECEPFAIHVGGQELAMHDPRYEPGLGAIYLVDATPGRHTQANQYSLPPGYESGMPGYGQDRGRQAGRGHWIKEASCLCHVVNASGVCLFGYGSTSVSFVPEFIEAATGWTFGVQDMLLTGERIANLRQAFNAREGLNALSRSLPLRAYGRPPLVDGPTAGVEVQVEQMVQEYLSDMEWTQEGAVPLPAVLTRLGLADVCRELWR
ncbi:MAG TPA: aldehyde ferredoxin oxidoreductase family protein [Anaerolineae bacterium]|nr:aldehyde ferredoxin oxidoreductase family protein [Anaerolineae bacterium]